MYDRILNIVAHYYYCFYFVFCIFSNSILLFLILKKTPNSLKTMRLFLVASNFNNFCLFLTTFSVQIRLVNNEKSLAMMCQGFCKYFGPGTCFFGYGMKQVFVLISDRMNMQTLYYRMIAVKYYDKKIIRKKMWIFSLLCLPIIMVIILRYIPPIDFDAVYNETLQMHPEYDFEPFGKFGGHADSHHICFDVINFIHSMVAFSGPILGFFIKRSAMKELNRNIKSLSFQTAEQFRFLLHGLSNQILIPLICYAPVIVMVTYNNYSGSQIIISQYLAGVLISLPAALDPLVSIYFILPYRQFLKNFFKSTKNQGQSTFKDFASVFFVVKMRKFQIHQKSSNHRRLLVSREID